MWCLMVRYGCVRHLHGRTPIDPSAQLLALFAMLPPLLSTARLIYGLLRTEPLSTLFLLIFLFVLLPSFLVAMCFFFLFLGIFELSILYFDYVLRFWVGSFLESRTAQAPCDPDLGCS